MKNEITLVILIEVQPEKAEEQIDLYNKIKPLALDEKGCLQYEMSRVADSDVKFVLIARRELEASLVLHHETSHMKEADAIRPSFRAGSATVTALVSL